MIYVCDTHAFLWYLTNDSRLSKRAEEVFSLCERGEIKIIIPSIVLLECIDVLEKKKVDFELDKIFELLRTANNFSMSDLDWQIVVEAKAVKNLPDLHDRVIVATAKCFNGKIISRDLAIRKNYKSLTIW